MTLRDTNQEFLPLIFDPKISSDKKKIDSLLNDGSVHVVDVIKNQIEELQELKKDNSAVYNDMWIYYPWRHSLVHTLDKANYIYLRSSRNRNLITEEEQEKFRNFKIGIAGLNVGNPGALCLVLEGGTYKMKFADFDTLSLTNLNRFRSSLCELNINKAILSARQAFEIDPYLTIDVFDQGITKDNISKFLLEPKIDLLIEEMDNVKLKIEIRKIAKFNRIPVLMVTGNGENVIIDVERYDLDNNIPLLNGYLKQEVVDRINSFNPQISSLQQKALLARDFMGAEFLTERLQKSFLEVGDNLVSIPQLAESSFLRGAALCYFSRKIALGEQLKSGRYFFDLSSVIK